MNYAFDHVIIGAGFSGICAGIRLQKAGMKNFVILERRAHIGGTWWDNRYPGAVCDVESHLYSYSFEPNPNWSHVFSPQPEILNYLEHCLEKYGLSEYLQLNTNVTGATFDEASGKWTINTSSGNTYTSAVLISCGGGLSQPILPDIKGIESFKGEKFHSARWDQDYSLRDKTVAVIGTGASAIQIVPAIAAEVKELKLFQRTPPWIMPKPDQAIPGWRKAIYRNFPFLRAVHRSRLYWMHEFMAIGFTKNISLLKLAGKLATRNIRKSIADEDLRKKVTPTYVMGCKRVLLSNDYYPALQRKNVEVVTEHIQQINETGVVTNAGKQYNVDAIIFATGFQAAEGVVAFSIKGRKGIDLNDAWRDGAEAYLGTSVSGFPNLFLVVGPNTGLGHSSMILMIEAQVQYIVDCLKTMKTRQLKFVDVKKSVQEEFNKDLQQKMAKTVWQSGGCSSWYQTHTGKNVTLWPGFTFTFMKRTKKFEPEKYELVRN